MSFGKCRQKIAQIPLVYDFACAYTFNISRYAIDLKNSSFSKITGYTAYTGTSWTIRDSLTLLFKNE